MYHLPQELLWAFNISFNFHCVLILLSLFCSQGNKALRKGNIQPRNGEGKIASQETQFAHSNDLVTTFLESQFRHKPEIVSFVDKKLKQGLDRTSSILWHTPSSPSRHTTVYFHRGVVVLRSFSFSFCFTLDF